MPHAADWYSLRGRRLRTVAGEAAASPARDKLVASHSRVRQHITSANSVIDLLLTNVAQQHRGSPTAELHNMSKIVATAIDRYQLQAASARHRALLT